MRWLSCGTSGAWPTPVVATWHDLDLDEPWPQLLEVLMPGREPRPVQVAALGDHGILESRKNLIVSAPTNSGKSLVGLVVLLEAVMAGKRAILIEPLKAIAREKVDELGALVPHLEQVLGRSLTIKISTGDYRIEAELPTDPPPGGEIVVMTPERLDGLMRNPNHQPWLETIGAVCVDEAHLISSPRRGPTLEWVLTALLRLPVPPRLVLLSATMGEVAEAERWLAPCEVVRVTERCPPLVKGAIALEDDEDANLAAMAWLEEGLADPQAQALVFVYQTRSASRLARLMNERWGADRGAVAYHSQMSQAQRITARQAFEGGKVRVLVTTTALAMGINLPATHVLVRDNTFPGVGKLSGSDLLQMMGRAGRGNRSGVAAVMVRPSDRWQVDELVEMLTVEPLPRLESAFVQREQGYRDRNSPLSEVSGATAVVAALLCRYQAAGMAQTELTEFLGRSLGGGQLAEQVPSVVRWLEDQVLAYRHADTQRYHLTVLGQKATVSMLPLSMAAGYAQLVRDVMTLDDTDELLGQWRSLDHLLLLDLLADRSERSHPPSLRRFSQGLADLVGQWCKEHPQEVPLVFKTWMGSKPEDCRTVEILGSLGVEVPNAGRAGETWAYQRGVMAMFRVMVMWERSQGVGVDRLEQRYGIKNLEGVEERWRDEVLWLVAGLTELWDIRTFYYHLREDCEASRMRVRRVKGILGQWRRQCYGLRQSLRYCSSLGGLLQEIRQGLPQRERKVGLQSIRRMEAADVRSLDDLVGLSVDDLVAMGLQRKFAGQVKAFVRQC